MRTIASFIFAVLVGVVGPGEPWRAEAAEAYPARPVKIVVGYTPGGFTDTMARSISDRLARALGQPVMIENKPGANGIIGADTVAKSAPDGYTLGMVIAAHSVNPSLYPKLPFDPLRDFAYVTVVGVTPLILVANNAFPPSTMPELLAFARTNPGKVTFGSSGIGAAAHLSMENFQAVTGTKMLHVPYKGTAPALADLIGGQIAILLDSPSSMMPHVRAGKIKALGIGSHQRLSIAPELPTIAESVPGYTAASWAMLLAPAKTPKPIVSRLATEVATILRSGEVRDRFVSMAVIPGGNSPEEATEFYRAEVAKWGKVVKDANVKLEN